VTKTYQELTIARNALELPEETTLHEIKAHYRKLLKQWHPDTCPEPPEHCHEMTRKIIAAYNRIMAYCNSYKISFSPETVHDYLSPEERWFEQFGDDPVWGGHARASS